MYNIGQFWINVESITHAVDGPTVDRIIVYFQGDRTLELVGDNRQKLLEVLEKEATDIR